MNRDCLHPSSSNLLNDSIARNHYFNQLNPQSPDKQCPDGRPYVSGHDLMGARNDADCFSLVSPEDQCPVSCSMIPSSNVTAVTVAAAAVAVAEYSPNYYQYYLQRQHSNFATSSCSNMTENANYSCTDNISSDHIPMSIGSQIIFSTMQSSSPELDQLIEPEDINSNDKVLVKTGMVCLICEDKATGKHYGAYSCDGCKGFFRRSVRRNHSYTCRYKRNCIVTKDKRNQCRFCRLRKCFRVGMKKSAVQNERDKISTRPSSFDGNSGGPCMIDLQQLMYAEAVAYDIIQKNYTVTCKKHLGTTNSIIDSRKSIFGNLDSEGQLADVTDICESIKTQLIFLIEWAKNLPSFTSLTTNDQIVLLQSHAGEMLILGAVWRSLNSGSAYRHIVTTNHCQMPSQQSNVDSINLNKHPWTTNRDSELDEIAEHEEIKPPNCIEPVVQNDTSEPQLILLGNSRIISRKSPQPEIAEIATLIFDQLYQPMQDLCLEEAEVACLRAIIFFDPNCPSLSEAGRAMVRACQYHIQLELMHIMNDKQYLPQGRFGALLLLLPDLRSVTYCMVQKLEIARQMGLTRLDGLLTEILLSSTIIHSNLKNQSPNDGSETLQHLDPMKYACNRDSPEDNDPTNNRNIISNDFHDFKHKPEHNLTELNLSSTGHIVHDQAAKESHTPAVSYSNLTFHSDHNRNLPIRITQASPVETLKTTNPAFHSFLECPQTDAIPPTVHFSQSFESLYDPSSSTSSLSLAQGYRAYHRNEHPDQQTYSGFLHNLNPIRKTYMSSMFDCYNHSSPIVNSSQRFTGTDLMNPSILALQCTNIENFENMPNTDFQSINPVSTITSLESQPESTLLSCPYSVDRTFDSNHLNLNLNAPESQSSLSHQPNQSLVESETPSALTKPNLPDSFVHTHSSMQPNVDLVPQLVGNVISNMFVTDEIQQ